MKKIIAILILLAIAAVLVPAFTSMRTEPIPITQVEMISKSMQSVVAVYAMNYDKHIGSGFYVGNGIIITAGHITKNEIKKIAFRDGTECPILEQIKHPDYDVGILIINDPNKPVLKFNLTEVKQGEVIFIFGNPAKEIFVSTKGIIAGRTKYELFGETLLIITDAVTWGGSSGSIVVDVNGDVRGVHVGWLISRGNYGVTICAKDILKALEEAGLEIN